MKLLFTLSIFLIGLGIFWGAKRASQRGQFYSDTPWFIPLGVFVWGDGLVLGLFWSVTSLSFPFISWLNITRLYVLFYTVRSAYEVIYWINHQVAKKEYLPPLVRRFTWIKAEEAGIVYQLINMCWVVVGLMVLILTWQS